MGINEVSPSVPSLGYLWGPSGEQCSEASYFVELQQFYWAVVSRPGSSFILSPSQLRCFLSLTAHVGAVLTSVPAFISFCPFWGGGRVIQSDGLALPLGAFIFNHFYSSCFSNVTNCLFSTHCLWLKYVIFTLKKSFVCHRGPRC